MQSIKAALISTDPAFRALVQEALADGHRSVACAIEIGTPFAQIEGGDIKSLREIAPHLVFLDLEDDPMLGIRFAQFLTEAHPSLRFLATGPELSPELLLSAMRAGIADYLPKPLTREALTASIGRMEKRLGQAAAATTAQKEPGKLLAVFSVKGGSGATTVATNLGIHLQRLSGKRVLLLDLELELGEIAVHLGMQPRFNFVDMTRNFHRMDSELLASYIERHESGVHLLSAPLQPERAEAVSGEQIRTILRFLREHYDYVVVDTPKSFSPATTVALEEADQVLLLTTVDLPSLRNIKRSLPLLDRVTGSTKKVHLLLNRYQVTDPISLEEVERTLGLDVHRTLANDYEAVSKAINAGKPVVLNGGTSAFARDLKELGAGIAGIAPTVNARGRFGSLTKLFGRKVEEKSHA